MLVHFGSTKIRNNQTVPLQLAQQPIDIKFTGDHGKLYTILMYDLSSPQGTYMHYQVSNIKGSDLSSGDVVFKYQPPNPPAGTGLHTYVVEVDRQGRLLPSEENKGGRAPVPLEELRKVADLTPVAQLTFQVPASARTVTGYHCGCGSKPKPMVTGHHCGCGSKPKPMVTGHHNRGAGLDFSGMGSGFLDQNTAYPGIPTGIFGMSNRTEDKDWFLPDAPLSEADRKYCRCTVEVAGRQPRGVNPYAVCHASVKGESGYSDCTRYFDFTKMPDQALLGFTASRKLPFPAPTLDDYNRSSLIEQLEEWRASK